MASCARLSLKSVSSVHLHVGDADTCLGKAHGIPINASKDQHRVATALRPPAAQTNAIRKQLSIGLGETRPVLQRCLPQGQNHAEVISKTDARVILPKSSVS
jgi:hypothetical protein